MRRMSLSFKDLPIVFHQETNVASIKYEAAAGSGASGCVLVGDALNVCRSLTVWARDSLVLGDWAIGHFGHGEKLL